MTRAIFFAASGAIAAVTVGLADVFGTPVEVMHYLGGLAVGLWFYPRFAE